MTLAFLKSSQGILKTKTIIMKKVIVIKKILLNLVEF